MNWALHKGLSAWVISAVERPESEQTVGRNDLCGAPAQEKVRARLQAKDEGVAPERCVTSSSLITPAGARASRTYDETIMRMTIQGQWLQFWFWPIKMPKAIAFTSVRKMLHSCPICLYYSNQNMAWKLLWTALHDCRSIF